MTDKFSRDADTEYISQRMTCFVRAESKKVNSFGYQKLQRKESRLSPRPKKDDSGTGYEGPKGVIVVNALHVKSFEVTYGPKKKGEERDVTLC